MISLSSKADQIKNKLGCLEYDGSKLSVSPCNLAKTNWKVEQLQKKNLYAFCVADGQRVNCLSTPGKRFPFSVGVIWQQLKMETRNVKDPRQQWTYDANQSSSLVNGFLFPNSNKQVEARAEECGGVGEYTFSIVRN